MNRKRLCFVSAICMLFWAQAVFAEVKVRLFSPPLDYTGEARRYTVTTTETMKRATLVLVESAQGTALYRDLPMPIEGGIYATTQQALTLSNEGEYRFHVAVLPASGDADHFFSFTVHSQPAPGALKNFTVSDAPYYVDQSLEVAATFTKTPGGVEIGILQDGNYRSTDVVRNKGGLEAVGYLTPLTQGDHEIILSFTDSATGRNTEGPSLPAALRAGSPCTIRLPATGSAT